MDNKSYLDEIKKLQKKNPGMDPGFEYMGLLSNLVYGLLEEQDGLDDDDSKVEFMEWITENVVEPVGYSDLEFYKEYFKSPIYTKGVDTITFKVLVKEGFDPNYGKNFDKLRGLDPDQIYDKLCKIIYDLMPHKKEIRIRKESFADALFERYEDYAEDYLDQISD